MSAHEFLQVEFVEKTEERQEENAEILLPFAASKLFRALVINAKLLTKEGDEHIKRVYEMTISEENTDHKFEPGDTIGIIPQNGNEEIDEILTILQLQQVADLFYRLSISENCKKKNATIPKHLPKTGSVRSLFVKYLDIRSPPKKVFLKMLADSATLESDREKLNHICSPNGSDAYFNLIANEGRTLLGLLKTFPSCKCTLVQLLEHLPPIKPRPYSISSTPLLLNELKIIFSAVHHDDGTIGLCSGYLERIANTNQPQHINFYFRKPTKFRIPPQIAHPIIMIGPGTGVAPFIGFLQHRHQLLQQKTVPTFSKTWLFSGCRYRNRDELFANERELFLRSGVLTNVNFAFSRENDEKRYVQHDLVERGKEVFDWIINEDAVIYVCGDGKNMAKDVKNSFVEVFAKYGGGKTAEEAEGFLRDLEKSERYLEDVWR